ncbi:DUF1801 domain-containing protein [Pendulispora brunnea]|uniref:DUF1801 domain-containing protein n=1 Tax=Pendulispora brunnea TaxID=2905690 RepID=A0ABZ2K0A5_9BACT
MFRVDANSLDEYFSADPSRERDLRQLDALIRKRAPSLAREFFRGTAEGKPGMSMKMIGYGKFQYKTKSSKEAIDWPLIGLALQKNYISLYVSSVRDGQYVIDEYAGQLGKVSTGKGCIRFKRFEDLDLEGLTVMLKSIEDDVRKGRASSRYNRVAKE